MNKSDFDYMSTKTIANVCERIMPFIVWTKRNNIVANFDTLAVYCAELK